ncbi:Plasmid stabilization system protein [Devosia sp. LC5]|uniref:type II toxin-antitoxin system RelE/ParE family toxin n=1 Tax=Devosia sp. LC5 TaxID=1502724 RepID=UPI0004E46FF4|nr:type II toxin-antitoxin system RelE/ParE family toxin [Devosia sp. LC5]KFC67731.1 Plasmid stabilization system protein [Devosia sp. LC5]
MAFRFSAQAAEDIYFIYENGKRSFGERAAELYYLLFLDAAELASRHPLAAAIRDDIGENVRVRYGSHAIFYQLDDPDIVILRVLHQSQDWQDQI